MKKVNATQLLANLYHGCHSCGEERIPLNVKGILVCPECRSENIVCIETPPEVVKKKKK